MYAKIKMLKSKGFNNIILKDGMIFAHDGMFDEVMGFSADSTLKDLEMKVVRMRLIIASAWRKSHELQN